MALSTSKVQADGDKELQPWVVSATIILYVIVAPGSFMVFTMYWGLVYPYMTVAPSILSCECCQPPIHVAFPSDVVLNAGQILCTGSISSSWLWT